MWYDGVCAERRVRTPCFVWVVFSYEALCFGHLQVTTESIKKEDLVTADDVAAAKEDRVEEEQELAGEIEKEGEVGVSARRRPRRET